VPLPFVIECEHAVGSRRKNEDARIPVEKTRCDGLTAADLLDDFSEPLDFVEYHELRLKIVKKNTLSSTAKHPYNTVPTPPTPGIVRLKLLDLISQRVRQNQRRTVHLDRLPPFLGNPLLQSGTKLAIKFQSQDAKPGRQHPAFFSLYGAGS
jgi:hypothetical protein